MSFKKLQYVTLAAAVAMLLHTVEEYITKLWDFDPFIIAFYKYFHLNPPIAYLGIQALALLIIFIVLVLAFQNRFNKFFGALLGMIFLLELLHPYNSLRIWGYYSGLYTGLILVFIGYFYWKELIKLMAKK